MRNLPLRYLVLGVTCLLLVGHFIGQRVSESYATHTSIADLKYHAGLADSSPLSSTWSNGVQALHGGDPRKHHVYARPEGTANTTRASE